MSLGVAIALHSSERLRFLGCEKAGNSGRVIFRFADPQGEAPAAELEFSAGRIAAPVNLVLASQRFLRQQMTATLSR